MSLGFTLSHQFATQTGRSPVSPSSSVNNSCHIVLSSSQTTTIIAVFKDHKLSTKFTLNTDTKVSTTFLLNSNIASSSSLSHNALITCDSAGGLFIWGLTDGKLINSNTNLFNNLKNAETMRINALSVGDSNDFLYISGSGANFLVLSIPALEIVKSFNMHNNEWISAFSLYPSDIPQHQNALIITTDNYLTHLSLNETNMQLVAESQHSLNENGQSAKNIFKTPVFDIKINFWDTSLFFSLENKTCQIYSFKKRTVKLLRIVHIPRTCNESSYWTGGQFTSSKTFILWNNECELFMYYIGQGTDIIYKQSPENSILLANAKDGFSINITKQGLYNDVVTSVCDCILYAKLSPHIPLNSKITSINENNMIKSVVAFTRENKMIKWDFIGEAGSYQGLSGSNGIVYGVSEEVSNNFLLKPLSSTLSTFNVTSGLLIPKNVVVLGLANGNILLIPLPQFLLGNVQLNECEKIFKGHEGRVSCLLSMKINRVLKLLSSGDDCTLRVWDIESGILLSTIYLHSLPTTKIIQITHTGVLSMMRSKCAVISFSEFDGSVCLVDVEEDSCNYRLTGNDNSPIVNAYWKCSEELILLETADRVVYVWQLKTGHLDRCENSAAAVDDLLNGCDYSVAVESCESLTKSTISGVCSGQDDEGSFQFFSVLINLKKLLNHLYKSESAEQKVLPEKEYFSAEVIKSIFCSVFFWGVHDKFDEFLVQVLQLNGNWNGKDGIVVGTRGTTGKFSIPSGDNTESISSLFTSKLLFCVSFVRGLLTSIASDENKENLYDQFMSFFNLVIKHMLEVSAVLPDFTFLATFWQDTTSDIQQAARCIISMALMNLSILQRNDLVSKFSGYLPMATGKLNKYNMRAAIVLGIVTVEQPSFMDLNICKNIAESLDIILKEEGINSPYKLAAIELMGKGLSIWMPYLNPGAILRSLIQLTGLGSSNAIIPTMEYSASDSMTTSTFKKRLTPVHSHSQSNSPTKNSANVIPQHVMMIARQAVVSIATTHGSLFISTITFDLSHTKTSNERVGCLKLLGLFITKNPLLLYPHLRLIVEAIVKSLDPNNPQMRENLQTWVTLNLSELVKSFPMISFHAGTQRLACGAVDGVVIVYDLKTATRAQALEGHKKPISAVSLSNDGKLIVTFSLEENCVNFWHPVTGFFGALAHLGGSVEAMKVFRSFNVGAPPRDVSIQKVLDQASFEWISERAVKLKSVDGQELTFSV